VASVRTEKDVVYRMMNHKARMADPRSMGLKRMLENLYPALANKVFKAKTIFAQVLLTGSNPMDMMDMPVCGKCESLAGWKDGIIHSGAFHPQCKCEAAGCGAYTTDPVTFRVWLREQLKQKKLAVDPQDLDRVVDFTAARMLAMATGHIQKAIEARMQKMAHKMDGEYSEFTDVSGAPIKHETVVKTTKAEIQREIEEDEADPDTIMIEEDTANV